MRETSTKTRYSRIAIRARTVITIVAACAAWSAAAGPQGTSAAVDNRETGEQASAVTTPDRESVSPEKAPVTFNRDIAPIIFQNCTVCHRTDGSAPFPLKSYQDARKRVRQIAAVTESRFMPPWLPKEGYGEFAGARGLTDEQIALIARWAEEGAAEGDPSDLPRAPEFTEEWPLGDPDLVVRMPEAYTLRAGGTDVFRYFIIPFTNQISRYVRRVELRPGNRKAIHHANILIDTSGESRHLDLEKIESDLDGMAPFTSAQYPAGHLLSWQPGTAPYAGRDDKAWRLDAGTDLVLNLHMLPSGKPEQIQPYIGFYFTDTLPKPPPYMLVQLENDNAINIPAGKNDFTITDTFTLPVDVEVIAVYPHAHLLGKDLRGYADLPNGTREWLIWIDDWDWNWQAVYRYAQPLALPAGSIITMRYTYDNSDENIRNPHNPPRRVLAGNRTEDEMGHLWVQLLPQNMTDFHRLEEMFARHKVSKYPDDPAFILKLGTVLGDQGRYAESVQALRKVVLARPDQPMGALNLGISLMQMGELDQAMTNFIHALDINPLYAVGLLNLGYALAYKGETEDAIDHYRAALEINPVLYDAHFALGMALVGLGKLDDAIIHYRRALEINPSMAAAHFRLGLALSTRGELDAAVGHYRQVLKIDPTMFLAHYNLAVLLMKRERPNEAIVHFRQTLDLNPPGDVSLHHRFARALQSAGRYETAITHYRKALGFDEENRAVLNNLALILATCSDETLRRPLQAVELAQHANRVANKRNPFVLRTLAAAHAAAGQFDSALAAAETSLELATQAAAHELADEMRKRIESYKQQQ